MTGKCQKNVLYRNNSFCFLKTCLCEEEKFDQCHAWDDYSASAEKWSRLEQGGFMIFPETRVRCFHQYSSSNMSLNSDQTGRQCRRQHNQPRLQFIAKKHEWEDKCFQ